MPVFMCNGSDVFYAKVVYKKYFTIFPYCLDGNKLTAIKCQKQKKSVCIDCFFQSFQRQISNCPENFQMLKKKRGPLQSRGEASTNGDEGGCVPCQTKARENTHPSDMPLMSSIDVSQESEVLLSNSSL